MTKLQKREYMSNDKEYSQFRINISTKIIEELRWNGNDEIKITILDGKIQCKNLSIKG